MFVEFDSDYVSCVVCFPSPAGAGTDSGAEEYREQDERQPQCNRQCNSRRCHSQGITPSSACWRMGDSVAKRPCAETVVLFGCGSATSLSLVQDFSSRPFVESPVQSC